VRVPYSPVKDLFRSAASNLGLSSSLVNLF